MKNAFSHPNAIQEEAFKILKENFKLPEKMQPGEVIVNNIPRWDSFSHLQLVLALEEHFQIYFDSSIIPTLTTLKIITEEIKKMLIPGEKST